MRTQLAGLSRSMAHPAGRSSKPFYLKRRVPRADAYSANTFAESDSDYLSDSDSDSAIQPKQPLLGRFVAGSSIGEFQGGGVSGEATEFGWESAEIQAEMDIPFRGIG